ncbi:MAG: hypothetical protein ABI823_01605 [Bryobacteraceae bacterium]
MMLGPHARTILWAQWRTLRNFYPKFRGGSWFGVATQLLWYALFTFAAWGVYLLLSTSKEGVAQYLSPGLLLVFLYWQLVPILLIATGASLDLRKLVAYPIPPGDLFSIEVLLRVTSALEMFIVLIGAALGLLANPHVRIWAPLVLIPFLFFNLYVATGMRDLIARLMARRRIREVMIFLFVMAAAAPQLLVLRQRGTGAQLRGPIRNFLDQANQPIWPWGAAANLADGTAVPVSLAALSFWIVAAYAFARWQFARSLNFDEQAAAATIESASAAARGSASLRERLYRIPSSLFKDPLAALVEKELRFLTRAPRFRMVFFMGFTFGMVIWLPILLRGGIGGESPTAISSNFLTVITLYSMLLLGEVCYWNSFGFDRSAAQAYFVFPVPIRTVLIAKNIAGLFFTFLEMTLITLVCILLRMPVTPQRFLEATAVAIVLSFFLLAFGNLTSTHHPRPVNPGQSMRSTMGGSTQMVTLLIYPASFLPVGLAYAARYAFDSELAFYGMLVLAAGLGVVVYRIALESAVNRATAKREQMIDSLAKNDGPMGGLGPG